jgi:hypothetical protein
VVVLSARALAAFAGALLAVVVLLLAGVAGARAAEATPEYRVKAAFVYKFCDYVEWPEGTFVDDGAPLVIGVLASEAMADELVRLTAGRTVGNRPVRVRRLAAGEAWTGLHVAFVGAGAERHVPESSPRVPVLVVSEAVAGPPPGGMVNFVVVADKVRFDVVLPAAEAAGLRISSRLLGVARRVETAP